MPGVFATEVGKRPFDDARAEAQAARGEEELGFAEVRQQAHRQLRPLADIGDGELKAGRIQHLHGVREAEAIGVQIGVDGGLVHPGPDGRMGQQETIELLGEQFRRRAAHRSGTEALMDFDLVQAQFDFPALMGEWDQFQGWSRFGVKQGGQQAMRLAGFGRLGGARGGQHSEVGSDQGMQVILDDAHRQGLLS